MSFSFCFVLSGVQEVETRQDTIGSKAQVLILAESAPLNRQRTPKQRRYVACAGDSKRFPESGLYVLPERAKVKRVSTGAWSHDLKG